MIYNLSNKLVNYLEKINVLKNKEKEIYLHGARLTISTGLGIVILMFIGYITGNIIEAVIYELLVSSSRNILGGYHCKNYYQCILVYVGLFVLSLLCTNVYSFSILNIVIIEICGAIVTFVCCPVENINKQTSINKKMIFKSYSYIYIFLLIGIIDCLCFFESQYLNIVVYIFILINLLTVEGKIDYEKNKE